MSTGPNHRGDVASSREAPDKAAAGRDGSTAGGVKTPDGVGVAWLVLGERRALVPASPLGSW